MSGKTCVNVVILVFPGVEELDLFGAYAPLVKAGRFVATRREWKVLLAARQRRITCSGGATVSRQHGLDATATATALVLPGGAGVHEAARDPDVLSAIRRAERNGASLYSICSGAFLLGAAGLAAGREVAVHAAKRARLATETGCLPAAGLVRHGGICSVGGRAGPRVKAVSVAFQLLRDLAPETVDPVAARLEVTPGPAAREPAS
jgi:putative intracellular protease/amidase